MEILIITSVMSRIFWALEFSRRLEAEKSVKFWQDLQARSADVAESAVKQLVELQTQNYPK